MARRSIVDTSVKITGDASGMVAEFNRADNASRRSAANIDAQVDKLARNLKRKFSASDIGKDVLRGLGIGSGFAIAQQAAEVITGYYERAAEAAKSIEESSRRSLNATLEMIKARQDGEQQLVTLRKQYAAKERELLDAGDPAQNAGLSNFQRSRLNGGLTNEQRTRVAGLSAELNELGKEIQLAGDKLVDSKLLDFFGGVDSGAKSIAEGESKNLDAMIAGVRKLGPDLAALKEVTGDEGAESLRAYERQLGELAKRYADMANPANKYREQLAEVDELMMAYPERAAEWERATQQIMDAWGDDAAGGALNDFFGSLDEQSKKNFDAMENSAREFDAVMAGMWNDVSDRAGQMFADMVLTGEASFGQLAEIVARTMLEIVARMAIINPLMNAVFGGMSGWTALPAFFGGGRASGGPVSGGTTYLVGEDGPELFSPRTSGTIIPNNRLSAAGGGDVYHIDARGADSGAIRHLESVIMALNGSIEPRAVAAVRNAGVRGKV